MEREEYGYRLDGRGRPLPRLKRGMLVAFSISTEGTADLFPDTPQVREALKAITPKKHLGIVSYSTVYWGSANQDWRGARPEDPPPLESTVIEHVAQSPPHPSMYHSILPESDVSKFSVPIGRAQAGNPRLPLQLSPVSKSFPFEGSLACTTESRHIIVEFITPSDDGIMFELDPEDLQRFGSYMQDDTMVFEEKGEEAEETGPTRDEETLIQLEDENEVESVLSNDQEFAMPPFELIYDISLELNPKEIVLDLVEYRKEVKHIRDTIEAAYRDAVTNPAPPPDDGKIQGWVSDVEKDETSRKETRQFERGLGFGLILGIWVGGIGGFFLARFRMR